MKLWTVCLAIALVISGSAMADTVVPDINPETPPPADIVTGEPDQTEEIPETTDIVVPEATPWLYPIPLAILDDPLDVLRLVNKVNLLDDHYPPQDIELYALVESPVRKTSRSPMQMRQVAADALDAMFAAADADKITLYVSSAYRSYQTQSTMHYNRVKQLGKDDGMVQVAGASDHQTGLGFDVISSAWRDRKLNANFAKTKEAQWMAENCARFGFVIRYPENKFDVTGINFEPWHLRYVGVEVANYMTMMGLTLEEFTAEWKGVRAEYDVGIVYDDGTKPVEEDVFVF